MFKQKKTLIYISKAIILLVATLIVTVDDNPPGIILSFISGLLFVLTLTHNFEKSKSYILLFIGSIIGSIL